MVSTTVCHPYCTRQKPTYTTYNTVQWSREGVWGAGHPPRTDYRKKIKENLGTHNTKSNGLWGGVWRATTPPRHITEKIELGIGRGVGG